MYNVISSVLLNILSNGACCGSHILVSSWLYFWMPGNGHIAEKYHSTPQIYIQSLSTKATIKSDEEK